MYPLNPVRVYSEPSIRTTPLDDHIGIDKMDDTTKREFFQAAVDGDLEAIQAFFEKPDVAPFVAHYNAVYHQARETALIENSLSVLELLGHNRVTKAWFYHGAWKWCEPLCGFIFDRIIKTEQLEVFKWFLSAGACEIVGDTMCGLVHEIVENVNMWHARHALEVFELILQSDLCTSFLSPAELKFLLQQIMAMALVRGHVDLFQLAVANGADANETIRNFPVVSSSYSLGSVHFVEILQESGILIMQQNNLNLWPTHKNADVAFALIEFGLDMNGEPGRDSKLHRAVRYNDFKTVKVLVKHGYADLSDRGDDDLTPLMISVT